MRERMRDSLKGGIAGSLWALVLGVTGLFLALIIVDADAAHMAIEPAEAATGAVRRADQEAPRENTLDGLQAPAPSLLAKIGTGPQALPEAADAGVSLPPFIPSGVARAPQAGRQIALATVAPDSAPEKPAAYMRPARPAPEAEPEAVPESLPESVPVSVPAPALAAPQAPAGLRVSASLTRPGPTLPAAAVAQSDESAMVRQRPAPARPDQIAAVLESARPAAPPITNPPALPSPPDPTPRAEPAVSPVQVRINRPGTATAEPAPAQETELSEPPQAQPALQAYAAAFIPDTGLPLMGVILRDQPDLPPPGDALAALPFPVTVLLSPTQEDVTRRMARYRAAGAEVAMTVPLPPGASAADLEVAFAAAADLIPDAAIVFGGEAGVPAASLILRQQLRDILSAEGFGYVTAAGRFGAGIGGTPAAGLPAAALSRQISADLTGPALRRVLDRAGFDVRRGGQALIMAPLTPALLDGLADWAGRRGAAGLQLAPASAILLDQGAR